MGEVFLADDTRLKRNVVLKFLSPHLTTDKEAIVRFEGEARAAAALDHPNIITIHEIGEFEGQLYKIMQYVEGMLLRERLYHVGPKNSEDDMQKRSEFNPCMLRSYV